MQWSNDFLANARSCKNWQDIQDNGTDFISQSGFRHFFILGSFFNNYSTPFTRVLTNYCNNPRYRRSPAIHDMLAEVIDFSMQSASPVIRGKLRNDRPYNRNLPAGIKHVQKNDRHSSISFPVHFPAGRFALLHLGTHTRQQIDYETVMTQGYQYALAICSQFINLLDNPFPALCLSDRERSCLLYASDGISPRLMSIQLGLSQHTIQYYLKNARRKLHSRNMRHAVSHALCQGEVKPYAIDANALANAHIRAL